MALTSLRPRVWAPIWCLGLYWNVQSELARFMHASKTLPRENFWSLFSVRSFPNKMRFALATGGTFSLQSPLQSEDAVKGNWATQRGCFGASRLWWWFTTCQLSELRSFISYGTCSTTSTLHMENRAMISTALAHGDEMGTLLCSKPCALWVCATGIL